MSCADKLKIWVEQFLNGELDEPECSIRLWIVLDKMAKELGIDLSMSIVMYDPLYQTFRLYRIVEVNGVKYYVAPKNVSLPLWIIKMSGDDELFEYVVKFLKDWNEATERWRA